MGLRSIPVNRVRTSTKRSSFSGFTFPVISSGAELFILPRSSTSARAGLRRREAGHSPADLGHVRGVARLESAVLELDASALQGDLLDLNILSRRRCRGRSVLAAAPARRLAWLSGSELGRLPRVGDFLEVQPPVGLDDDVGKEIGEGDLLGVDEEGVVADRQVLQGERFPLQDVVGGGLLEGAELAEVGLSRELGLQPFRLFDAELEATACRDEAVGDGDLDLVRDVGLEWSDVDLLDGHLQVGGHGGDARRPVHGHGALVEAQRRARPFPRAGSRPSTGSRPSVSRPRR